MPDTLTIIDNRTGQQFEVPVLHGTYPLYGSYIRTADLKRIKAAPEDFGLLGYDPAFMNTASCRSAVTFIDGDRGILRYRGYDIEELATKSSFLEVAYLLLNGELPTQPQLDQWTHEIRMHTMVHESVKKFVDGFRHDAHPMGMLVSTVAALSTFYPDSKDLSLESVRRQQIIRLIAKMPTLAAYMYRHSVGLPYVMPDNELGYCGNFFGMMFRMAEPRYTPDPVLERALNVLFILHADHEQNCSTNAMRSVGSSHADPYVSVSAATAALYGPLHGGANEQVLRMLREIGTVARIPEYISRVKAGEFRLMGFGHRVYKNYDPRARILRDMARQVFERTSPNPLLGVALELERISLEDDYFVSRKLYPNVDFYSGLIYQAMGFPVDMFPVLFAIPRTAGWLAQWDELIRDDEQKISRPRQIYTGEDVRAYPAVTLRTRVDEQARV
ncbi:MAG TPA: citrate synthase [Longimicrobiales bacterium]|nr:citrate synthase [Longimicrobiales bacterium]